MGTIGPTTVCLTLLRWLIASSSRFKVALTISGGVRASHCAKDEYLIDAALTRFMSYLAQTDVLECISLEDFEEAKSSVADVLHVVAERARDVS